MAEAGRVVVPRLLTRSLSMWLSVGAGVLAVPAVGVWAWVTRPESRLAVAIVVLVAALGWVALLWRRTWLEPDVGVVREVAGVWRRRVPWGDARSVRLVHNHARQVVLEVRGAGGPVHLPILADDLGGPRSQPPAFLRTLADHLERGAPPAARVAAQLRAQADHLEAGGSVGASPLARLLPGGR